jgi:GTP-sensing pleiotropic transcriptional regulator CodY
MILQEKNPTDEEDEIVLSHHSSLVLANEVSSRKIENVTDSSKPTACVQISGAVALGDKKNNACRPVS